MASARSGNKSPVARRQSERLVATAATKNCRMSDQDHEKNDEEVETSQRPRGVECRSTRSRAREEKRELESALALSLQNAGGVGDDAVSSAQRVLQANSRKRPVSGNEPHSPFKKPKTTQSADATGKVDSFDGPRARPRRKTRAKRISPKASKKPVELSVSAAVKQYLEAGLYADDKDLQARTEAFAKKEAMWLGNVQKGHERDHLRKLPLANMEYVSYHNGTPVLELGACDAPYNPQARKKTPKKHIDQSPSDEHQPPAPVLHVQTLAGSTTQRGPLDITSSPRATPNAKASPHNSATAAFRLLLRPKSSEAATVYLPVADSPASTSVVVEPTSSGILFPTETEEAFAARPSIKILVPDTLKGLLVDDWENITKNNQLVPIPHPNPVSKILEDYVIYEKPQRPENSASIDILEETVAGLKEYFDKSLGRILLYRFERAQYAEVREKWNPGGDMEGKSASETYGAEHLMRLMVSLPELIAQTNMDQQSVNRLREELSKFCVWLEKNAGNYFVSQYESPNAEYAEKAKN